MGNINYEMRRAKKCGMSLEEWMNHKKAKSIKPKVSTVSVSLVYHHTNILFSHLIWNSGVIDIESEHDQMVAHPILESFGLGGVTHRRMAKDFPRLAWFTSNKSIPRCLENVSLLNTDISVEHGTAIKLNRIAIEFALATAPEIVPWKAYYGYDTPEGQKLNRDAIAEGDDPDEWYISETPVSAFKMTKILIAPNWIKPVLNGEMDVEAVKFNIRNARSLGAELPPDWKMPSWQKQYEKFLPAVTT